MATGDLTTYNKFILTMLNGTDTVDFDTDTIKVVMMKTTFTPDTSDSSTQEFFDDISATEVATGTAYTGPVTLASKTLTLASGVVKFDADNITIAQDIGGGFTDGDAFVLYKDTGTPSTSPLILWGDFGSSQNNQAGSVSITWAAAGIFDLT